MGGSQGGSGKWERRQGPVPLSATALPPTDKTDNERPQAAGSYVLSAVADGDCNSAPLQQSVTRNMAVTPTYNAFYVEP